MQSIFRTLALTLAASVAILTAAESADAASLVRRTETARAEPGGVYSMPAGDMTAGAVAAETAAGPRRSPTPDAELVAIKARASAASDAAVEGDAEADNDSRSAGARALFTNCNANIPTGSAPPDIHGAASPTNLVVVTNRDIGVYNKTTCAIVSRVSLASFFSGFTIPATQSLFDPRVFYDRLSGRCFVVVESRDSGNTDQFLYVAGSTSSSCTSWRRVRFALSSGASTFCKAAASDFYDFPNAGYNLRRIVVSSNNFTSTSAYGALISIDKLALYGTAGVTASCWRTGLPTNMAPAVVGDSNASMFILSPGSGGGSSLRRLRLDTSAAGTGSDALFNTSSISVAAWTAPPDAVQPNGQKVDTSDGRFVSASKQIGGNLWQVHTINSGGFARWRLYKLTTTGTSTVASFGIFTTTCSSQHLFNASVDTNATAAGTLAFVSASRTCPTLATTGNAAMLIFRGNNSSSAGWVVNTIATSTTQFATDGFGTACNSTSRGSCRWGDYSSTQIDPSNTTRAWGFNQLTNGSTQFNWATRGALVGP